MDIACRVMTNIPAETLIVWTEPSNGIDMALSFQEAEGCAMIWYVIILRVNLAEAATTLVALRI